jgi:hypothetical protein
MKTPDSPEDINNFRLLPLTHLPPKQRCGHCGKSMLITDWPDHIRTCLKTGSGSHRQQCFNFQI